MLMYIIFENLGMVNLCWQWRTLNRITNGWPWGSAITYCRRSSLSPLLRVFWPFYSPFTVLTFNFWSLTKLLNRHLLLFFRLQRQTWSCTIIPHAYTHHCDALRDTHGRLQALGCDGRHPVSSHTLVFTALSLIWLALEISVVNIVSNVWSK